MVIFFDKNTREILYTERDVMIPKLPAGSTEEKIQILDKENISFIGVKYEMDLDIFNYKVVLDENRVFIGIQPKEVSTN